MRLLSNGQFYLGNNEWAEALLINEEGHIEDIFLKKPDVPFMDIDMEGRFVFPVFEDAHSHPSEFSRTYSELDLHDVGSWEEAKDMIRDRAINTPKSSWLVAHGWNESLWGEVSKEELDSVSKDHGIFLINISYHGGQLNSKGMDSIQEAGIEILNKIDGRPGFVVGKDYEAVFFETAPDVETYAENIKRYQEYMLSLGIGIVHDIGVSQPRQLEAYHILSKRGEVLLPTEIYVMPEMLDHQGMLSDTEDLHGVKLLLDGAIGTSTAALTVEGNDVGLLHYTDDQINEIVQRSSSMGLGHVAMHCIGTRAIDQAVRASKNTKGVACWRFEHFEMPSSDAISHLASFGGIASVQPNFSWDSVNYEDRLGDMRKMINPLREIFASGIKTVFGSDNMPTGPLEGLSWAVKKAPFPEQRIPMDTALDSYTQSPADVVGKGGIRGSLKKGKQANLVVLDRNIFSEDIEDVCVQQTWVRGDKRYDASLKAS